MLQIFKTLKMFFTQTGEFPILNVAISFLQYHLCKLQQLIGLKLSF